ncbi:hypothetical protein LTS09_016976 [Friedmanniomyces endolithicus]|nr:hypothetical protein LTS09_016976 [Friedmanniomyces endolithicus]
MTDNEPSEESTTTGAQIAEVTLGTFRDANSPRLTSDGEHAHNDEIAASADRDSTAASVAPSDRRTLPVPRTRPMNLPGQLPLLWDPPEPVEDVPTIVIQHNQIILQYPSVDIPDTVEHVFDDSAVFASLPILRVPRDERAVWRDRAAALLDPNAHNAMWLWIVEALANVTNGRLPSWEPDDRRDILDQIQRIRARSPQSDGFPSELMAVICQALIWEADRTISFSEVFPLPPESFVTIDPGVPSTSQVVDGNADDDAAYAQRRFRRVRAADDSEHWQELRQSADLEDTLDSSSDADLVLVDPPPRVGPVHHLQGHQSELSNAEAREAMRLNSFLGGRDYRSDAEIIQEEEDVEDENELAGYDLGLYNLQGIALSVNLDRVLEAQEELWEEHERWCSAVDWCRE